MICVSNIVLSQFNSKAPLALAMTERQGIEIDHCLNCRGVWLDRGELDKIIECSSSEMPSQSYPEWQYDRHEYSDDKHHRDHSDNHHHKHNQKKRGFLRDLFD
jgi:uncharacterized protein